MNDKQVLHTVRRIAYLLLQKTKGQITVDEQSSLEGWIDRQSPSSRQFFDECVENEEVESALQAMYEFDIDSALRDVEKKINTEAFPDQPEEQVCKPRRPIFMFKWLAVAAVFLIVIGISIIKKDRGTDSISQVALVIKNDVKPGGTRAILQLANGKQIVLDSVGNGSLARDGGSTIVKLQDGELSYNVEGNAAEGKNLDYSNISNIISTPRGGQYQVRLPDGSRVWLNAVSTLKFPPKFPGNERLVELTGEAYFEVAKNNLAPFRVRVLDSGKDASTEIDVLGTEFNVMAYADEVDQKTTLLKGAVVVRNGRQEISLKPGQQARVGDHQQGSLITISATQSQLEQVVAWKNGVFQFQDASIEDIMRQVARWYNVEVVYKGKVSQKFVGTIPRDVNLSTILKILESTGWIRFGVDGSTVTVSPK